MSHGERARIEQLHFYSVARPAVKPWVDCDTPIICLGVEQPGPTALIARSMAARNILLEGHDGWQVESKEHAHKHDQGRSH